MIKGEVRMLKLEDFKTAKKRVDEVIEETHLNLMIQQRKKG